MSSSVDQLPQQPSDPKGSNERDASEPAVEAASAGFDEEFAGEIRSLFGSGDRGKGLFGEPAPVADASAGMASGEVGEDQTDADETAEDSAPAAPSLFAASMAAAPSETEKSKPSIGLFLPRVEDEPERAAPALTGLALAAGKTTEPAVVPNLFVSNDVAPAEVLFVPAEQVDRRSYRWLLILLGLFFVVGAIWLTFAAQSGETVDAPVTTIETVPTTAVSTPEAPASTASTTAPTTSAPATTASTETTLASTEATVATTAPPQVQPTTPRRPATTARPVTAPPTTAAPTTGATVPDVTFAPPTWSPNPTAAAAEPPAGPAAAAPVEPAAPEAPAEG